jgi:protein-L-isoaspartate(D-aspartate) O-methyltransferase
MTDYELLRKRMVDNQLRTSSVTDRRILAAFGSVPREAFVPPARLPLAYADTGHAIANGRAMPAPAPLARLIQLGEIAPGEAVLVVGAGTGYGAAVVRALGAEVSALESDADMLAAARRNRELAGLAIVEGPFDGSTVTGDYDVILVEGAVDSAPRALLEHLKEGGRLVAPIRRGAAASATLYVRSGREFAVHTAFDAPFPPLQPVASDALVF